MHFKKKFSLIWFLCPTKQTFFLMELCFRCRLPDLHYLFEFVFLLICYFVSTMKTCGVHQTIGAVLPDKLLILLLDLNFWSYIHIWWFQKPKQIGLVFQLLIPACKNVSFMLSCLYFQALAPDDLGVCGLFCHASYWVKHPLFPHTLIKTSAMTHHSNNSVRDHMKWVSGTLSPESASWF